MRTPAGRLTFLLLMAPTHWQQCAMLGLGLCERRGAPFRNRPRPRRRPRPRKSISSQHFELMFRPGEERPCRMADLQNVRLSRGFGRLKCREEMPFEDEDDYEKASPHQIRITSLPPNLAALTPTGRSHCTIREKKYQRRPPLLAKDSARSYPVTYSLPDTRCRHAGPNGNRPGCNRANSRRDELAAPIPEIEPFAPWTHSRERFHPRHPAGICSDNRKCLSIWG